MAWLLSWLAFVIAMATVTASRRGDTAALRPARRGLGAPRSLHLVHDRARKVGREQRRERALHTLHRHLHDL